ncbi:S-layer homology domain-containing protein [Thermoanaerobacter sp. RKWS2]|uniref:S-layer homology domain-containing protein n=1 Tax=Thermoanaerobacter sp. RKWS2 TaxID=2983842 RepID=UPI00224B9342|nr:S-layer homology domain-containing protein [Thermoanaerobacter sp. RKWS2]UZQ83165.1 S-layer homology domain-containing protein [Thermoanaerobacter sp. RKWS2]
MKKIFTILLTIILFVLNSVYTYASDNPVYYGTDNVQSIYYNMSFKDIKDSFAKNYIMKMTALSVIRGGGSQKFYPKSYLKREEAIAYIVRLMGLEEQVQKTPISSSTAVGGVTLLLLILIRLGKIMLLLNQVPK